MPACIPSASHKLVAIEGLGLPHAGGALHRAGAHSPLDRESARASKNRTQHSYPNLAAAVARMKEANPFLSDRWPST